MVVAIVSALVFVSAWLEVWHGVRLYRSLKQGRLAGAVPPASDPPSVSVCIPARNETHALAQCLERVLASDYSKLEILVFDDHSGDDTSNIIRSFAQAGVRFVAGNELPEGWLGKNHALDVLAKEASGTYVLFMDVDTIITPTTIRKVVDRLLAQNKDMVSVIPERGDGWRTSVLFGHLRYFWELTVNTSRRPATASALWLVKRKVLLEELGGLEAYRSSVACEAAIAAQLGPARYESLISGPAAEVLYEKKWLSQVETSRRLLYPRANGTPYCALLALASLLLLNVPFFVVLSGLVVGWSFLQVAAACTLLVGMVTYGLYTYSLWRHAWWAGTLAWPVVVLQELILFVSSLHGYYSQTLTWKGRHPKG